MVGDNQHDRAPNSLGGPEFSDEVPGRLRTQVGPWGMTPIWILDPEAYLPGVPDPSALKAGDEKPLTGAELRFYIALRSYANQEGFAKPFVTTIARRAHISKAAAEKAISKFRRLGWLTTKRLYRDDGSIRRCDYWLIDICPQPRSVTEPEGVPANWRVPHPRNDGEGTREPEGAKNTPDEHTKRTPQGIERISTTFASSGGGDTARERRDWSTRDLNDARAVDVELFKSIVGERMRSSGTGLSRGEFDAQKVYVALLKYNVKKKPIEWPGRLLRKIHDEGDESAVEYFLARYGLEGSAISEW